MIRKIVRIDEELCDGCGVCVPSCAEGAIQVIDGKARLVADKLCDGLGACLGECPRGAITVIEREAEEYDEAAVEAHLGGHAAGAPSAAGGPSLHFGGCPGSMARVLAPQAPIPRDSHAPPRASRLRQWPVQLHLVPPHAPYFADCELLVAADCVGFAMPDFHERLLDGRAVAIACPKLDDTAPYVDKLAAILARNHVRKVIIAIMEVPCCMGLAMIVKEAVKKSGMAIPVELKVISLEGRKKQDAGLARYAV